jgi:DHA1 family tetracycline resistance protein-like MFS transporter
MIKKLFPILGITFVDILGFSILIPTLPYFVTHFGMAPWVVGVLASVFSLVQLISGPIWGNVSDRIGRKGVLIISQIGATIGWVMLAFAPSILMVFVARVVEGASGGNIGVTQAYVADLVEPKERSRAFGLIGAMFGCGMVFGPLIGSFTFGKFGFPGPFLAAAALQVVTLAITILMLPESRSKAQREDGEAVRLRDVVATLRNPHFRPILLQKSALSMALYGWYLVIALYFAGQLGFGQRETDYAFSAFALVGVFMNVFAVHNVSERTGDYRMTNLGICALVVGFALVPFVHNLWAMALVMVFFAFGQSLANSGISATMSNAASEREQGTVLGVGSSLDSAAGILAPPISTGIFSRYGPGFAGVESLAFSLLALAIGIFVPHKTQTHDGIPAEELSAEV